MRKLSALLLLWLVSLSSQAAVSVVLDGTGKNVTGLQGLDVGGTLYDVVIEYLQVGATQQNDIFLGNEGGALAAAQTIAAAINGTLTAVYAEAGNSAITYPDCFPLNSGSTDDCNKTLLIATEYSNACGTPGGVCGYLVAGASLTNPQTWSAIDALDGWANNDQQVYFAKFVPAAVVPLPPAVFLFGSGIMALAGISRCRRGGATINSA